MELTCAFPLGRYELRRTSPNDDWTLDQIRSSGQPERAERALREDGDLSKAHHLKARIELIGEAEDMDVFRDGRNIP
jgi:hypothetical protein